MGPRNSDLGPERWWFEFRSTQALETSSSWKPLSVSNEKVRNTKNESDNFQIMYCIRDCSTTTPAQCFAGYSN